MVLPLKLLNNFEPWRWNKLTDAKHWKYDSLKEAGQSRPDISGLNNWPSQNGQISPGVAIRFFERSMEVIPPPKSVLDFITYKLNIIKDVVTIPFISFITRVICEKWKSFNRYISYWINKDCHTGEVEKSSPVMCQLNVLSANLFNSDIY